MATLNRYRVTWSGFSGGPGVSTFYGSSTATTTDLSAALKAFFEGIKSILPSTVTISYPLGADQIDDGNGALVGAISVAGATATVGTGGTTYGAPMGMAVKWVTAMIAHKHRLIGHTFIVPAALGSPASGAPSATNTTTLQTAAALMLTTAPNSFVVWSRPLYTGHPPTLERTGTSGTITGLAVLPKFVTLRSRRD